MGDNARALSVVQWLLTPALVTGALLALARFFDAPTRWARRLRDDISILGGLPDGAEKRTWQQSVDWQARRLREYRRAFVGGTLIVKWFVLIFVAALTLWTILHPPINEPGDPYPFVPADYMIFVMGFGETALFVVLISRGIDFLGRTPREILLLRRLRQYNRRMRKLHRIEKERAKRAETDPTIRPKGSRPGFSSQVDEFGPWMRDEDLREYVRTEGYIAADFHQRAKEDLARRGVPFPPWPDLETGRAPEP